MVGSGRESHREGSSWTRFEQVRARPEEHIMIKRRTLDVSIGVRLM